MTDAIQLATAFQEYPIFMSAKRDVVHSVVIRAFFLGKYLLRRKQRELCKIASRANEFSLPSRNDRATLA